MIATLCVTNLTMGIGNLITNGTAIYDLPDEFLVLGRGYIGPIPVSYTHLIDFLFLFYNIL